MAGKDKIAFENGEDSAAAEAAEQVLRKGVKLNGGRSRTSKQAAEKEQFAQAADTAISGDMDRKSRAARLVNNFWRVMNDTTLAENQGPTHKSVESQLVKELIEFATEMNNDPSEPEGSGAVALITLLLKTNLRLRDNFNSLSFKTHQLEQQVNKLSSQVAHSPKTDGKS